VRRPGQDCRKCVTQRIDDAHDYPPLALPVLCARAPIKPTQSASMGPVLTKDPTMNRTNTIRRLLLSLSLAAGVLAAPAYAQISINIGIAPPAPQYEVVPMIAPGYVWAPGYWGWSGERHVWVRGRSIVQREGYVWAPDRWEQRDRGYYRSAGHWERNSGYKPVKMKEAKHQKDHGKDDRGHGNGGKHGGGGRHDG